MAVAVRSGRGSSGGGGGGSGTGSTLRNFFSYRIFVSAMFTLLFLATFSVLLSSRSFYQDDSVSFTSSFFLVYDFPKKEIFYLELILALACLRCSIDD